MSEDHIPFTRPALPPVEEVVQDVRDIWARGVVTNAGPVQQAFERRLVEQLDWPDAVVVSSGTTALQLLCSATGLTGEVVVAGFTHAATVQALTSRGLTAVHADIDPDSLTLDVESASKVITPRTSGLMVTHTFGFPADVEGLQALADEHGLTLLFDAAAATGVRYCGRSLAEYGDGSGYSFHATKLLCAVEGGAVVSRHPDVSRKARELRNFGISDAAAADPWGTNGKADELTCAVGLRALPQLAEESAGRGRRLDLYRDQLSDHWVTFVGPRAGTEPNHSYCCVRLRTSDGAPLGEVVDTALRAQGIESRRYFAGGYTTLVPPGAAPEGDRARAEVVCLPLWGTMPESSVLRVCDAVRRAANNLT